VLKKEEVTAELNNYTIRNLTVYRIANIIRVIKTRRRRWAGHPAFMLNTSTENRIFYVKKEGMRKLSRYKCTVNVGEGSQ
jgi:hypothetical protein